MVGQKNLKLEVAAMLDKTIFKYEILGNKKLELYISEPFNSLAINFIEDFSKTLKEFKEIKIYPDLIYLMFWCSKNKNLIKKKNNEYLRLGRGLIFHICPSNVPTNFIYSFFFGLLSGNSNIIKIPSKNFKEKDIIISVLKLLFNKKKYKNFKKSKI